MLNKVLTVSIVLSFLALVATFATTASATLAGGPLEQHHDGGHGGLDQHHDGGHGGLAEHHDGGH